MLFLYKSIYPICFIDFYLSLHRFLKKQNDSKKKNKYEQSFLLPDTSYVCPHFQKACGLL